MPTYFFTAKSQKGEPRSGTLEAKNEHDLARILRQEGYVLISASSEPGGEEKKFNLANFLMNAARIFGAVSLQEKMIFTRNMQVMISAGVPLPRALKILSVQSKNKKFQNTLLGIAEEITRGRNLSEAVGHYPDVFPELFYNMIKVGEESGTLVDVLKGLTRQMEREYDLQSKIRGAMIYPLVVLAAMLGIGVMMLIMVVPQLAATFKELNIELPPTTKFTIFLGTFLAEQWYLAVLIVIFAVAISRIILNTKEGKKIIDALFLRIPIISPIVKKINAAHTTRNLSGLMAAGVPIVRALEIVSKALGNYYYKEAIADVAEKVRRGARIAESLRPHQDIYPLVVVQMIEVGEETGQTSDILQKLADFFEEEIALETKNLSTAIEPVLMLIIGAAVGFFAISMIQPMYSMLGAL